MQPNNTNSTHGSSGMKIVILAVVVLVVLGGLYVWMKGFQTTKPITTTPKNDAPVSVVVSNTDLTTSLDKIPKGFPTDISIETKNVLQSRSVYYPENKSTLYTVIYKSPASPQTKYDLYYKYVTSAGYTNLNLATTTPSMSIQGIKDKSQLSFQISPKDGGSLVQIGFIIQQ
jgi:hypothetical protein